MFEILTVVSSSTKLKSYNDQEAASLGPHVIVMECGSIVQHCGRTETPRNLIGRSGAKCLGKTDCFQETSHNLLLAAEDGEDETLRNDAVAGVGCFDKEMHMRSGLEFWGRSRTLQYDIGQFPDRDRASISPSRGAEDFVVQPVERLMNTGALAPEMMHGPAGGRLLVHTARRPRQ